MKKLLCFIMMGIASVLIFGCDKEDPVIPNEEELITTLNYTLTPSSGGESLELSFIDLDGDGGNEPEVTGGTLAANTVYNGSVTLLNEAENPAEDITSEVAEEALDHQFFYSLSENLDINISYNDQDAEGNPIGLATTLTAGAAGTGTLRIILRHEPKKSADGVTAGNIANAGGETDIEVDFAIEVQ